MVRFSGLTGFSTQPVSDSGPVRLWLREQVSYHTPAFLGLRVTFRVWGQCGFAAPAKQRCRGSPPPPGHSERQAWPAAGIGRGCSRGAGAALESGPLPVVRFRFSMRHRMPAARNGSCRPEAGFWPERPRTGRRLLCALFSMRMRTAPRR